MLKLNQVKLLYKRPQLIVLRQAYHEYDLLAFSAIIMVVTELPVTINGIMEASITRVLQAMYSAISIDHC